ncbi:ABC transporter permease [Nocardioides sp. Kera G14]|uniref:ABC transporter permease n=1 Tax=Nocardioides sp. Kera G14 TaxID=2884264 RepID=UPI001D106BA2|nr:ABC transporter permease [Nocardioides sp. Kera G14]UDY24585.1 ABC transporter permease [Nocardioides sp. Kera G14]
MIRYVRLVSWEIWLPIVLLVAWWFASANSINPYFPPLQTILERCKEIWIWDGFHTDIVPSLRRLAIGFGAACVVGTALGVLLGTVHWLDNATRPYVELMRATPGVALMPVIMLVLGLGDSFKTFTIAMVCTWPILLNAVDGVRSVEPLLKDVATSYRLSLRDRIRYIILPNAAPQVFAGARTALAIGIVAMTVTEMVGDPGGVGSFTLLAYRSFRFADMWAGIIALGILGYILSKLFTLVENRVLGWHKGMTAHNLGGK